LKIGDPMLEETNIGPMAIIDHVEHLMEVVNDCVNLGGLLVLGGNTNTDSTGKGRFFEPTIIANANSGMIA
jgi:acyl-CoA reductase-like NAD-dependent aldehyde dehydrogenase